MEVQRSVVSHVKKLIYDLKAFILCIEVKTYEELWKFFKSIKISVYKQMICLPIKEQNQSCYSHSNLFFFSL